MSHLLYQGENTMMLELITELKYKIRSIKASYQLIKLLEIDTTGMNKEGKEYLQAYKYNSYIRKSRVKITSSSFEAKIRKPESLEQLRRLKKDYQEAVKEIAQINEFHSVSVDLPDKYYYKMIGS